MPRCPAPSAGARGRGHIGRLPPHRPGDRPGDAPRQDRRGKVSFPIAHRTVSEIWFFLTGRGEMWRELDGAEEIVAVESGVCITIPVGTRFQFRSHGYEPLAAIGVTMPPWPGKDEAYKIEGKWSPTK